MSLRVGVDSTTGGVALHLHRSFETSIAFVPPDDDTRLRCRIEL